MSIDIVIDEQTEPNDPRFVEIEDEQGASVRIGERIDRANGLTAIRITAADLGVHPPTREKIAEVLSAIIYDRGNRVPDWPADEAAVYREWRDDHSIAEAHRQVVALIIRKAADAVHALIQNGADR